ncbi:MAG: hypothetical protein DBO99_06080 [gamma proteobacterium symbiont of Ctena orbiculata]|nr:MAG: hypothetical protein DBO99_06080 [gamma proteobacterium symbiont of Ctena orbiculata]
MNLIRHSVYANGGTFSDPVIHWYAIGVRTLQERPLDSKLGWRFMAAIHGINKPLWQRYGYLTPGEPEPIQSEQARYWNQCPHGNWFFLPWHRGYIWALETALREAIIDEGGPSDWALPYWNYSDNTNPNARVLPPAFRRTDMPDGSPNPLFVVQRYGSGTSPIILDAVDVDINSMNTHFFTSIGMLSGFGGGKTVLLRGRPQAGTGTLEDVPHNNVHGALGGRDNRGPGLMSTTVAAALDPIFWLHHCNIDRLWALWSQTNSDSSDSAWLDGPTDRPMVIPMTDGSDWEYTSQDMLDTTSPELNYTYDELVVTSTRSMAVSTRTSGTHVPSAVRSAGATMASTTSSELIGANSDRIWISGQRTVSELQLDADLFQTVQKSREADLIRSRSTRSITESQAVEQAKQHFLLSLESVRCASDGGIIDVYVNLPEGVEPKSRPDLRAGSIALFGVQEASEPDQPHGGMGIHRVMDITHILENLSDDGDLAEAEISVQLVPRGDLDSAEVTIERIGLYRQDMPTE